MPRSKPQQVIEHRVTLGTWERDMLKEQQDAKNIRDIGVGVGVAAVGIGGTYVAYKIGKSLYEWGEDAVDYLTQQDTDDKGNKSPPRWARWLVSLP
jgi:hypothetical protein